MTAVIVPYTNPDLDGVACSIALEVLERPKWTARVLGNVDEETRIVLDALNIPVPVAVAEWLHVQQIWLVDTHHPRQLPPDLPDDRVVRVTDHHPGGDPSRYAKAEIQNDAVGAAATLVAERFMHSAVSVPPSIAILLQAAILSNTLEFLAPATSQRDRDMFAALATIEAIPSDLLKSMREARRTKINLETALAVASDVKIFETKKGMIAIAQIEAPGALELLSRPDLLARLADLAASREAVCAVLNLVDLEKQQSAVVSTDPDVAHLLAAALHEAVDVDGTMRVNRILQRKSDIVPFLLV
jgi:manganese-dependent inorganic pyrophosphatase